MKKARILYITILLTLLSSSTTIAQVNWISFEHLADSIRKQPKPVLIFIHTDWCKYCAMQENNTFTNIALVTKLNTDFYALKLNAEEKKEIVFLNRIYRYQPSGNGTGYHQLAELLGTENGKLIFPTIVFLSNSLALISRIQGFVDSSALLMGVTKSFIE